MRIALPTAGIFFTPDRAHALALDAQDWIGTPFKKGVAMKHVGADCANLVATLLQRAGVLESVNLPQYALDEGQHTLESKCVNSIRATGRFFECEVHPSNSTLPRSTLHAPSLSFPGLLPGDVLGFQIGRMVHHLGIAVSPTSFVHAAIRYGVRESLLADHVYGLALRYVFRARETGVTQ